MKTIGLIGGMSWESTLEYYRIINETVKERLGGLHSASCILHSVDFAEIEALQRSGDWDQLAGIMVAAALGLQAAGASFIVICANTMHALAPDIERQTGMPVLHIAAATGQAVVRQGLTRVALLGTRYTMEGDFYRSVLESFGLQVLIPDEADRAMVHAVIYEELCLGIVRDASREAYSAVIDRLVARGAEGIVLGCTEIPLLIRQPDVAVPVFDTTTLHAVAAVEQALDG